MSDDVHDAFQGYAPLKRLNLNLLYALDAILNARSLTEAGRRVFLSQPAMSLSLRKLRDQFGDELVAYVGGERVQTALAEALRPRVRHLLREVDETFNLKLEFNPAAAVRTFRFAAPEAIEIMLLGRVIPALIGEAPGIELEVIPFDHGNPARAFELGADMVVIPARFADPRFHSRTLMEDSFSCMVWQGHSRIGDMLSAEQYLEARHVAVFDPLWPSSHLEESARDILRARHVVARTTLHAALPGLLIGTDLVATASSWLLQHYASMMPLRVMHAPFTVSAEPIVAQWPAHRSDDPGHRWLLEHMVAATFCFTPEGQA